MKRVIMITFASVLVVFASVAIYILSALRIPAAPVPFATDFRLDNVTLINPGKSRDAGQSISVSGGVVTSVTGGAKHSGKTRAIQYESGAYVLPGLVDMHTHLPPASRLGLSGYFGLLFLMHGVTSVREAGDVDGTAVPAYNRGISRGDFDGPRVYPAGPFFGGKGSRWKNTFTPRPGKTEARILGLKRRGIRSIKVHDGLTLQQIQDVKAAARKHGMFVFGHVPARYGYEQVLIPDSQHFYGVPLPSQLSNHGFIARAADWDRVDEARMRFILGVTLRNGIGNTPTLTRTSMLLNYENYEQSLKRPDVRLMPRFYREIIWHPREGIPHYRNISPEQLKRLRRALKKKTKLLGMLHRSGAKLFLGADSSPFVVPGAGIQEEIRLFQAASIPLEDIWAMATWKAARAMGAHGLGVIQENAPADLLVFSRDPTKNLENLGSLQAVIVRGKMYRMRDLRAKQREWARHFEGFVFENTASMAARFLLSRVAVKREHQGSAVH